MIFFKPTFFLFLCLCVKETRPSRLCGSGRKCLAKYKLDEKTSKPIFGSTAMECTPTGNI